MPPISGRMYYLNDTPISDFGITPNKDGGNIAVQGCFDLPKRLGKTYYNWIRQNSVEPFVESYEITFDTREITLSGTIVGNSNTKVAALKAFLSPLESFTLSSKWGEWTVKLKSVDLSPINKTNSKITIKFTEVGYILTGTLPSVSIIKDIDDYRWLDFGLYVEQIEGYQEVGKRKELKATQNFTNSNTSQGGWEKTEITIKGQIISADLIDFKKNLGALYQLFGGSGLRTIRYRDVEIECFAVDGFQIDKIYVLDNIYASFNCKLIVV